MSKSWQKDIERKNLICLQNIYIPLILQAEIVYLPVPAEFGHYEVFEIIYEKEVTKNPQNPDF